MWLKRAVKSIKSTVHSDSFNLWNQWFQGMKLLVPTLETKSFKGRNWWLIYVNQYYDNGILPYRYMHPGWSDCRAGWTTYTSVFIKNGIAENLIYNTTHIQTQCELIEMVVRNHNGNRFPTSAHRVIVSLYSHFHPEAVGHIDGHRSSVAMGTHSVRISDVVWPEDLEGDMVGRMIKEGARSAESLSGDVGHVELQRIGTDL